MSGSHVASLIVGAWLGHDPPFSSRVPPILRMREGENWRLCFINGIKSRSIPLLHQNNRSLVFVYSSPFHPDRPLRSIHPTFFSRLRLADNLCFDSVSFKGQRTAFGGSCHSVAASMLDSTIPKFSAASCKQSMADYIRTVQVAATFYGFLGFPWVRFF